MTRFERMSLNQATIPQWSIREAVDGCARAGVAGIGLWREPVAETGVGPTAKVVRDAGLQVTSLCRGGFFTRPHAHAENRRAVVEAATLGAEVLVLVAGGLPDGSRDLDAARAQISDGIAELVPYARDHNVRLGIEPLHPMFCSDRCAVVTLAQALDLAAPFPDVGVVIDTYNVWWDPQVYQAIARARGRMAAFQVSDWITPVPDDLLQSRGVPGDGDIELRRLRTAVDAAGYDGSIEVEIFNTHLSRMAGADVLDLVIERYLLHVA